MYWLACSSKADACLSNHGSAVMSACEHRRLRVQNPPLGEPRILGRNIHMQRLLTPHPEGLAGVQSTLAEKRAVLRGCPADHQKPEPHHAVKRAAAFRRGIPGT